MALKNIDADYDGTVYIFPGDMGLIDEETILTIKNKFIEAGSDMLVLTGLFEGDIKNNSYGRIIRVKEKDADGKSSGNDAGKVIEINERLTAEPELINDDCYGNGWLIKIADFNYPELDEAMSYEEYLEYLDELKEEDEEEEV